MLRSALSRVHTNRWPLPRGPRRGALAPAIAALAVIAIGATQFLPADAAALSAQWQARVGSHGTNGSATLRVSSNGTAALAISLTGLAHATTYSETLYRGTCGHPTTKLVTLSSVRTSPAGKVSRTNSLTAAQTKLVNRTGVVIRFVAGRRIVCGAFAKVAVVPPPTPPGSSPSPAPHRAPAPGTVAATTTVGYLPYDVAASPTGVFVVNGENSISRVDPASDLVISTMTLGDPGAALPVAIAIGDDGDLWVARQKWDASDAPIAGDVVRVDPGSGQVRATVAVGRNPADIAVCAGSVWITNFLDTTITRIDPATGAATPIDLRVPGATALACGGGSVWISNERIGAVSRLDPADNHVVVMIATLAAPEGLVFADGQVWVAHFGHEDQADGALSKIDASTNKVVTTITVGKNPSFVAAAGGSVWVSMYGESTVVQVDATTTAVLGRLTVRGPSFGIAAGEHAVWVVQPNEQGVDSGQPGTVTRIAFQD